ncbi:MAG TPA: ABC transporter permease [Bryobacteraceae bacterium]|nr:ABC transporter permease [Bryobacteraceae bacterium]
MPNRWSRFFHSSRDRELEEEIQAHLAMAKQDRIERGEAPASAEIAAHREFGDRTLIQEITREMWGWSFLESLRQDLRSALRGMRRSPGFAAVAVLSLALGIGANTAIFTLIDAIVLRSLPVQSPEQLVQLLEKYPGEPRGSYFSLASYEHYRARNHVFSGLIAASSVSHVDIRAGSLPPEIADGEYVSGNLFSVLGVRPAIGRLIGPDDDHTGAASAQVAVVSWSYWKSRFNLDSGILGKRIALDGMPVVVIGVAPRGFFGIQVGFRPDIWMPLSLEPMIHRPSQIGGGLRLMARLKPGVSLQQAQAEMRVLFFNGPSRRGAGAAQTPSCAN